MKIKLNGNISEFKDGSTIAELLEDMKIEPKGVAVEVNLEIIKRHEYDECVLKDGDSIEIVNFVGGG